MTSPCCLGKPPEHTSRGFRMPRDISGCKPQIYVHCVGSRVAVGRRVFYLMVHPGPLGNHWSDFFFSCVFFLIQLHFPSESAESFHVDIFWNNLRTRGHVGVGSQSSISSMRSVQAPIAGIAGTRRSGAS